MSNDGPNYEKVFDEMICLNGLVNLEDREIIKRYLRFYTGQPKFDLYIAHYSKLLPQEDLAEFGITVETTVEETTAETSTEETEVITPKKKKVTKSK